MFFVISFTCYETYSRLKMDMTNLLNSSAPFLTESKSLKSSCKKWASFPLSFDNACIAAWALSGDRVAMYTLAFFTKRAYKR